MIEPKRSGRTFENLCDIRKYAHPDVLAEAQCNLGGHTIERVWYLLSVYGDRFCPASLLLSNSCSKIRSVRKLIFYSSRCTVATSICQPMHFGRDTSLTSIRVKKMASTFSF